MLALIVHESMFGNTRTVADRIAAGLRPEVDTKVVSVADVTPEMVEAADLLVVGGPTHAHGMSRPSTRRGAPDYIAKQPDLELEPGYDGGGVREWLDAMDPPHRALAAAFDTRVNAPAPITGRASKGEAKRLRRVGFELVAGPESFLVDKHSHLLEGEANRAEAWGSELAARLSSARPPRTVGA